MFQIVNPYYADKIRGDNNGCDGKYNGVFPKKVKNVIKIK